MKRFGDYILHQRLNEGGMAEVFLATNPQGQTVAVRRLRSNLRFNPLKRINFKRGAKIQIRMHGPHTAHIFELQTGKLIPFVVMEYIEGVNLRQAMLRREDFLPNLQHIFLIFERIVKGIGEIHLRGNLHLDIKPENIMLDHSHKVKILDFDLARPIPKKPKALSSIDGTPTYLAPELIRKEPVDERTDIFALGIMGYELFTGRKPIDSQDREAVFQEYLDRDTAFPSPTTYRPDLPKELSDILLRCIDKRFEFRSPTISVILRDLRKIRFPESSCG